MGKDLEQYEKKYILGSSGKKLSNYEADHLHSRILRGDIIENILLENFANNIICVKLQQEPNGKNAYVSDAKLVIDEDELIQLTSQFRGGFFQKGYFSVGTIKDLHDGKVTNPFTNKPIDFFTYKEAIRCLEIKVQQNYFDI